MGELHAFAERIGLSQRTFDEDHYDVPAEFYDAAVEQGARPVSGSELIRILRGSGLRVPGVERSTRVVPVLRRLWQELRPQDPDLGEDLLARWRQEHRAYHPPVHLYECLQRLDVLTRSLSEEVLLAAWFHDAVYEGIREPMRRPPRNWPAMRSGEPWGEEVARLVLLMRDHRVESGDHEGALLIDADLGILASPEPRYRRYVAGTRKEYAQYSDAQWRKGRSGFIRGLLGQEHIFFTLHGRPEWEEPARANLQAELAAADLKDHMRR